MSRCFFSEHNVDWNSSEIISRLVSLVCSLSASWIYSKGTPEIFTGVGVVVREKVAFGKALISLNRSKIGPRLLDQEVTRFRLMPKSTTLDDLKIKRCLCTLFSKHMRHEFIYFKRFQLQKTMHIPVV